MILKICYNDSKFFESVKSICNNIKVEGYDETNYKEKKKAYKIKGSYSARMTPFMLLLDDDEKYIKAFYSEAKECTLDNLKHYLDSNN